jgi:glycyl-tRNA synthetase
MEFFCRDEDSMKWYDYWREQRWAFYTERLGIPESKLRIHDHDQLAHYAKAALDIEFDFPFGWGEIEGVHHRGTWDLTRHEKYSGKDMTYFDQETNTRFHPTVVETSCGLDRIFLMLLANAYDEDLAETQKEGKQQDVRVVLRLPAAVAPVQAAILPLSKKLGEPAHALHKDLRRFFRCEYDETGSIGKRYRRQDEIGTPFCVTYDFESEQDGAVTIRDRDAMTQDRVSLDQVKSYVLERLG